MTERYRVVVADDAEDIRVLVATVLEQTGRFQVVGEAADGAQAVEAAAALQPDLTLLDLSMPVMDGLTALPLIRERAPSSVVVVLSGLETDEMADEVGGLGAAGYIRKGLSPADMVAQLLDLLELAAARWSPPGDEPTSARVQLPADVGSGAIARRYLGTVLADWGLHDVADTVKLLTTELVTNAVVHASSDVDLHIRRVDDGVRVEVADTGGGALVLRTPWGTATGDAGKIVWFELRS